MDGDLLLIFSFVLVAGSIALLFATATHRRMVAHEQRTLELKARKAEAESGSGGASYRKLEERVRVLERIATDSNHALATQIDQLREVQEIEDQTSRETAQ